jgi:hypothetical protein
MIKTILFALLVFVASAVASSEVNVFLCDFNNRVRGQKSLSHGRIARICFQPTSQSAQVTAVDSFVLSQDGMAQVVVSDGRIDSSISDLQCDESMCVLETYFLGDFFLTGELSVAFSSQVEIQQNTLLRGPNTNLQQQVQGKIDVKTHPLPVHVNVRHLEASNEALQ